jgi:hypothetical protein
MVFYVILRLSLPASLFWTNPDLIFGESGVLQLLNGDLCLPGTPKDRGHRGLLIVLIHHTRSPCIFVRCDRRRISSPGP